MIVTEEYWREQKDADGHEPSVIRHARALLCEKGVLQLSRVLASPGQIAVKMSVASAPHRKGMQANHVAQGRSQLSVMIKNYRED